MGFPHPYFYFICYGWFKKMGEKVFPFYCCDTAVAAGGMVLFTPAVEYFTSGNCFVTVVPEFEKISNDSITGRYRRRAGLTFGADRHKGTAGVTFGTDRHKNIHYGNKIISFSK